MIFNGTLYAYQPDAFQSLPLQQGGQWAQLPMGVSVKGAKCVQASAGGQDALFIVGGATDASVQQYPGLQLYTFVDQKWQLGTSLEQVSVTQNRLMHGAAYLESSSSILVYGGFQDDSYTFSTQTFTISTQPPYAVRAYTSEAPPVMQPILTPLNQSHAVMLGGNAQNKQIWTFSEEDRWQRSSTTLQNGLEDISKVQVAVVNETDGSKLLEFFDESVSPNHVTTISLPSTNGQSGSSPGPGTSSTSLMMDVAEMQRPRKRRRQNTTPSNQPAYNSTLAPQITRTGFSLSQDSSGLVVISGGAANGQQTPFCMFDQTGNQWIDANQFFDQSVPSSSSTPTTAPSPAGLTPGSTANLSATSSSKPVVNSNASKSHTLAILGAVLGAVFGLAALLIIALLLIRCLHRRRIRNGRPRYFHDDKHKMDFADQGADFMKEAGGSRGNISRKAVTFSLHNQSRLIPSRHTPTGSGESKEGLLHNAGDSAGSAKSLFGISISPPLAALALSPSPQPNPMNLMTSTEPIEQPVAVAFTTSEARTDPRTGTGWSKYWDPNNGSTTNLATIPPSYSRYEPESRTSTYTSADVQSDYTSNSRVPSSHPHESAEVPPLNIRASQFPTSVHQAQSPILDATPFSDAQVAIHPGPIDDCVQPHPNSEHAAPTVLVSNIDDGRDSSDEYALQGARDSEVRTSWTPVAASTRGSTFNERAPSSVYTNSVVYPHPGERVQIPNFPRVPSSKRSSVAGQAERGLRSIRSRDFANGTGQVDTARAVQGSDETGVRPFPRSAGQRIPDAPYRQMTSTDMSWLNLGR